MNRAKEIGIAIDAAASELYDEELRSIPLLRAKVKMTGQGDISGTVREMIQYYQTLAGRISLLVSLEDGLQEDDWEGWKTYDRALWEARLQLVGDDLFVTNVKRLACGIRLQAANAILIKVNQIGTLSRSDGCCQNGSAVRGIGLIISHRSGETEDSFIADLAVAVRSRTDQNRCTMPVGAGMQNIISFSGSVRCLRKLQFMKIHFQKRNQKAEMDITGIRL